MKYFWSRPVIMTVATTDNSSNVHDESEAQWLADVLNGKTIEGLATYKQRLSDSKKYQVELTGAEIKELVNILFSRHGYSDAHKVLREKLRGVYVANEK
jgi:uncharacterized protein YqgQ